MAAISHNQQSQISFVFFFKSCHVIKSFRYLSTEICFTSYMPVTTMFSSSFHFIICPTITSKFFRFMVFTCNLKNYFIHFSNCPSYSFTVPQKPHLYYNQMFLGVPIYFPYFTSIQLVQILYQHYNTIFIVAIY